MAPRLMVCMRQAAIRPSTENCAGNRHLAAAGVFATILPAMAEDEKQFSITRLAS
jgi:hypothetical protein